jgi:hypothetical protein
LGHLVTIIILTMISSRVWAGDSVPTLKTAIKGVSGKLALEVSGRLPDKSDWLGVSFYKPNYTDWIWDGEHKVFEVKTSDFTQLVPVPAGFEGGTYEAALWKDRLAQKTVYKLETILGYGAGYVQSGPVETTASDSIAPLRTAIETRDHKTILRISGKAPDKEDWLGVSFYKANYADAILDGDYSTQRVAQGEFSETIAVPAGFETGSYEVALWKHLNDKKDLYKLATLQGYASGPTTKE